MLENIRISFQGIWSHKMRSFLTMLGIIIGIASIISIVSTIKGTNEQIKQNLIGSGNNTVEIKLYQGESPYQTEYYGLPTGVGTVSDDTLTSIKNIEHVDNASMYVTRDYADSIFYQSRQLEGAQMYGIDKNFFDTAGLVITNGRGFYDYDYQNYMKVAVLDKNAAEALFSNENPLGKTLEIKGEPFVIVGICEKSSSFAPVINSIEDYINYVGRESGIVYLPISSWPIINCYDEPENVMIKASSTDFMSDAGHAAADILNSTIQTSGMMGFSEVSADEQVSEDDGSVEASSMDSSASNTISYKAVDLTEKAKNLQKLSEATNQQLLWIASISLLVGGIGVMNIMLVSVTERTREIGLKKAIGAKNSTILWQFLTEAAVLTSFGGLLGIVVGIILAQVISRLSSTPVAISIPAIIASVVFSMVIGIIFGLLPSVKASKLNPIDALRHE